MLYEYSTRDHLDDDENDDQGDPRRLRNIQIGGLTFASPNIYDRERLTRLLHRERQQSIENK